MTLREPTEFMRVSRKEKGPSDRRQGGGGWGTPLKKRSAAWTKFEAKFEQHSAPALHRDYLQNGVNTKMQQN